MKNRIICLFRGHVTRFIRTTSLKEKSLFRGAKAIHRCNRCGKAIYNNDIPSNIVKITDTGGSVRYEVRTMDIEPDIIELDTDNPSNEFTVS